MSSSGTQGSSMLNIEATASAVSFVNAAPLYRAGPVNAGANLENTYPAVLDGAESRLPNVSRGVSTNYNTLESSSEEAKPAPCETGPNVRK